MSRKTITEQAYDELWDALALLVPYINDTGEHVGEAVADAAQKVNAALVHLERQLVHTEKARVGRRAAKGADLAPRTPLW